MDRKIKMKVINKLLDAGFDDEKKVINFGMRDMIVCDVKGEEIGVVLELQDATKAHKVISFLADEKKPAEDLKDEEVAVTANCNSASEESNDDEKLASDESVNEGGDYYG